MVKKKRKKWAWHVQLKWAHTGWRLASRHYTKKSAEKEIQKWRKPPFKQEVRSRIIRVNRSYQPKGLALISRSGRVLGFT